VDVYICVAVWLFCTAFLLVVGIIILQNGIKN